MTLILGDVSRETRTSLLKSMATVQAEMQSVYQQSQELNKTVMKYDGVYTNVVNYTHDSNCFTKDYEFLKNYAKGSPSYYFGVYFPVKPEVFVSFNGLTVSKLNAVKDTLYVAPIYDSEIFNDHFSMGMQYFPDRLRYERIQICYYAFVNPSQYLPND